MYLIRLCLILLLASCVLTGCEATYPKETLSDSIIALCRKEYDIEIKAEKIGKTLAIYIPLPSLLSITLGINKDSMDKIQDVLLSTSRVVLSTDAGIEFYCIIAQDIRMPEIQVIIIKYVDDVKRAFFYDISRGEYFKRTIFDININPQSRKEQTIKDIFKKYRLDPEWEEQVLDEFFRSTPLDLKDFGYWNGQFYVKDIDLDEFLAAQMAYRIKARFREDKELSEKLLIREVSGAYETEDDESFFSIAFDIKLNELIHVVGGQMDEKILFRNIIEEISNCVYGYKFMNFKFVKVKDMNTKEKIFISKDEIYALKKRKIKIDALLGGV